MTQYIDFVPKRSRQTTIKHPEKPIVRKPITVESEPELPIKNQSTKEQSAKERQLLARPAIRRPVRRIDFARLPKNHPLPEVKVKKTVQISIASTPEIRDIASQDAMPERLTTQKLKAERAEPPASELEEPELDNDEPLMSDDDLSLALAGFADDEEASPSLRDDLSKEASDLEDELNALDELDEISDDIEAEIADFVEEPKPIFTEKKPDSPDANKYSLGGRSPFLTSVKVEKRPLSSFVPEENAKPLKSEAPAKNSYRAKIKQVFKDEEKAITHRETTIVSTPDDDRSRTVSLVFAIILTIILGALVGGVVYLVFFQ